MWFYHAPVSGLFNATGPLPPPLSDPKIYKKTSLKKGTCLGAVLATRAAQKEYSGELGSQNDFKMEPKMEPKVSQKGSLLKNMKKQKWTTIYYT